MIHTAQLRGYFYLALCQLLVGANVAFMKNVVGSMPIMLNIFLRFSLATALLAFFHLMLYRTSIFRVPTEQKHILPKEWALMAILGFLGGAFNFFMMQGVKMTSAMSAGIISSTLPMVVALFSWAILKERVNRHQAVAIVLAVVGILCLNLDDGMGSTKDATLLGGFLVFMAIVPEALYTIVCKFMGLRLRPLAVATIVNAFNIVYFLPFAAYEAVQFDWSLLWQGGLWLWILLIALCSGQFYILWQMGLETVPAQTAGVFTGLMPLGASWAATQVLGETFTYAEVLGMLFVVVGVTFACGIFHFGPRVYSKRSHKALEES